MMRMVVILIMMIRVVDVMMMMVVILIMMIRVVDVMMMVMMVLKTNQAEWVLPRAWPWGDWLELGGEATNRAYIFIVQGVPKKIDW